MRKVKRIRRSAAMWRELFSRQSSSGLSVPVFCRHEGINASLFRRWRSSLGTLGKVIRSPVRAEPPTEVPAPFIDLGGIGMGGPRFEVRLDLGAGIVLSIARG
jgi:putative transposase